MLTPEEIASRQFLIALRGYDRDEVTAFLEQVADDYAALQRQIEELQAEASQAPPEPAAAPAAGDTRDAFQQLGEETTRILVAAQDAAAEMRRRADEEARTTLAAAQRTAQSELDSARSSAAEQLERARSSATEQLEQARSTAAQELERARREAEELVEEARHRREVIQAGVRDLEAARAQLAVDLEAAIGAVASAVEGLQVQPSQDVAASEEAAAQAETSDEVALSEPEFATPGPPEAEDDAEREWAVESAAAEVAVAAEADDEEAIAAGGGEEPSAEETRAEEPTSRTEESASAQPDDESARADEAVPPEESVRAGEAVPRDDEAAARAGEESARAGEAVPRDDEAAARGDDTGEIRVDEAVVAEVETPAPAVEPIEEARSVTDVAAVELRERALQEIRPGMVRRLKRTLQDVQNGVLDAIRRTEGTSDVAVLLPGDEDLAPLEGVGEAFLSEVYDVGLRDGATLADAAEPDEGDRERIRSAARELRDGLAHEITTSLEATLRAGLQAEEELGALTERVGEVFRDLKGPVAEAAAETSLIRTYQLGVHDAWRAAGLSERIWVVGDEARCPENRCRANASEGRVALDREFPSGDVVPPAHRGCVCTVAPAR